MRPSQGQQRFFLSWARPAAILLTFALFAALRAATGEPRLLVVGLAAFALATSPLFALAARRFSPGAVLRAALVFDTFVIAGMAGWLARSDLFVLGFVWAMTVSALLFGARETLFFSGLGIASALAVSRISPIEMDAVTLATDVLVLALAGGVLSLLSRNARTAQAALARERAYDAAALHIAERVRSSLDLDEILNVAVAELGTACEASRALLRVAPRSDGSSPLFEWVRPGVEPLRAHGLSSPPVPVVRMFETGEPFVVEGRGEADQEVRAYMESVGAESMVGHPVVWQGRMLGAIGFHDDRRRAWRTDVLPLLERIAPQLGAALAQAELFGEQRATLERLQEFARVREELIATVSHEFRTPLTATIGFLRTVESRGDDLSQEERRQFLAVAREQAERLAVLVEDLLQLTRLQRGALPLSPAPVDLAELAREAVAGIELPEGREIRTEVEDGVVVDADRYRLLQVLSNLLANGLRHGSGTVVVRGEREDGRAVLSVSDEGVGIPPERVPDLFVPFSRVTETSDTGLGLVIARAIVEAHDGSLTYRPPERGRPHAFVVSLPSSPQPVAA